MFDLNMSGYQIAAQIVGFLGTIIIVIGMQQKNTTESYCVKQLTNLFQPCIICFSVDIRVC